MRHARSQSSGSIAWLRSAWLLAVVSVLASEARAIDPAGGKVRVSGFANVSAGGLPRDGDGGGGGFLPEVGVQVTPQWKTQDRTVLAARVTLGGVGRVDGFGDEWTGAIRELSVFAIGPFGRIEIGERAAFPQTLLGYAPAEIAFANAEYGPESGARLTPNGRLPTTFLAPTVGRRIDALTYLGYAARLYDNSSPKVIYVSPRKHGLYAGLSYAPRSIRAEGLEVASVGRRSERAPAAAARAAADFENLLQAALVWQKRTESLDLTLGATYSHAQEEPPASANSRRRVDSLAAGVTATLHDTWEIGLSATYDGFSEALPGASVREDPFGVVASLNWIGGSWFAGGYYQFATAPADASASRSDRVHVAQLGAGYLIPSGHELLGAGFHTDLKLYASAYYSRFADGITRGAPRADVVLLIGARFSFY
jgi:hypothetical protein